MKFEKKSTLIIGGIAGVCVIGAVVTGFALNSSRNNVNPDKDAINVLAQETTANISKNEIINSSTNASETTTNISEQSSEELESTSEEAIEEVIEETIEETNNSENYEEPQTEKTVVEANNNNNYYSDNEESENDNDTSEDNDYSEPENNYDDNNYSDNSSDYEEPETEAKTEEVLEDHLVYHDDGSLNLQESYAYNTLGKNNVIEILKGAVDSKELTDFLKNNNINPNRTINGHKISGGFNEKITAVDFSYTIEIDNGYIYIGFDGNNFYFK